MLPVPALNLESDTLEDDFKLFKFMHEQRMTAAKISEEDKEIRGANFLGSLPPAAQLIVMNYNFAANGKDKYKPDDVIAVICAAKKKKLSRIVARNRFLGRTMRPGESFSDFKTAVIELAGKCGYEEKVRTELVRDHIIRMHTDETFQSELLKLPDDTTLDKLIELCERHEDTMIEARELQQSQRAAYPVNAVNTVRTIRRSQKAARNRRSRTRSRLRASTDSHRSLKANRAKDRARNKTRPARQSSALGFAVRDTPVAKNIARLETKRARSVEEGTILKRCVGAQPRWPVGNRGRRHPPRTTEGCSTRSA
jgi:hypothetical protein